MEKYYAEFSVIQNCFHVDTLENIKKYNLSLCKKGISNGYVIIGGPFNGSLGACKFTNTLESLKEQGSTKSRQGRL